MPLVWHGPWQVSVFKGFEFVGLGLICCKALSSLSFCFSRCWEHGHHADLRSLLSCLVPWTKGQRQLKDTSASSSLHGKVMRCFWELSYWREQGGWGEHLQHLLSYYTTLFLRASSSPGEIHVAVPNTLWTQLMIWAVKCLCSKNNNKIRLRLLNLEMWGLDSPGPFCWHCFQTLCSSRILFRLKKTQWEGGQELFQSSPLCFMAPKVHGCRLLLISELRTWMSFLFGKLSETCWSWFLYSQQREPSGQNMPERRNWKQPWKKMCIHVAWHLFIILCCRALAQAELKA